MKILVCYQELNYLQLLNNYIKVNNLKIEIVPYSSEQILIDSQKDLLLKTNDIDGVLFLDTLFFAVENDLMVKYNYLKTLCQINKKIMLIINSNYAIQDYNENCEILLNNILNDINWINKEIQCDILYQNDIIMPFSYIIDNFEKKYFFTSVDNLFKVICGIFLGNIFVKDRQYVVVHKNLSPLTLKQFEKLIEQNKVEKKEHKKTTIIADNNTNYFTKFPEMKTENIFKLFYYNGEDYED